jgi:hypothetical protein
MFREALKSLAETTQGWDVEIVAVVDNDKESAQIALEYDVHVIDYSTKKRGALWSWNRALFLTDGKFLVPAGDDQMFRHGWLEYALESHRNKLNGYGVVGMNDLAYDGNLQLATMFMFDRQYCKDHMGGVFAPPVYRYFCVDSEWNAKAKSLERFYWDERSIIEHLHVAHGKRDYDQHDQLKEEGGWMAIDNKTFEERKAQGFPITWQSLI